MDAEAIIHEMADLELDLTLLEARLKRQTKSELDDERGKRARALRDMRRLRMKLQQMEALLEHAYS